jgi:hypothetical protein
VLFVFAATVAFAYILTQIILSIAYYGREKTGLFETYKISWKQVFAAMRRYWVRKRRGVYRDRPVEVPGPERIVEKEVVREVPGPERVVEKEIVREVPVERVVEKPIEVVREVPVDRIVTVDREVPVERIVEKPVEVVREVPVDRVVEKIVEVIKPELVLVPVPLEATEAQRRRIMEMAAVEHGETAR